MLALVGVLGLAGCQWLPVRPSWSAPPLLAPQQAGMTLQANQRLTLTRGADHHPLLAVLATSADDIRLSALGPLGQRLLDIRYDGRQLEAVTSPRVETPLSARWILAQMQLAYWPLNALQSAYGPPWRLRVTPNQRILYLDNDRLVTVTYRALGEAPEGDSSQSGAGAEQGDEAHRPTTTEQVVIVHHRLDLTVTVTTLKVRPSEEYP